MGDQCAHGGSIVVGMPTVLIGEAGGGGGGAGNVMPVNVILQIMQNAPAEVRQTVAQVAALQQAAANGNAFCEECNA
jgi:hypothetical protein